MIATIVKSKDPVQELIAVKYLNICLLEVIADTYELLTCDDIYEPCLGKKKANVLLDEVFPECYPKKKVLKSYKRVFRMLMADTVMSADPVTEYVINYALGLFENMVEPAGEYSRLALESFIERLKDFGLTEAEAEIYKSDLADALKELEGKNLKVLFGFAHYDSHLMDAMTKQELRRMEKDFRRQTTPLMDYLVAKNNKKAEEL